MNTRTRISGFGFAAPPRILTNAEFEARTEVSDEWIVSRTGIRSRHILEAGQNCTDLALEASRAALAAGAFAPEDITHIIYATCTPDAACPSAACTLAAKLGLTGRMALDINAACAGFVYGLEVTDGLLARNPSARVLLVAAEALSHRCNMNDPGTSVLFGDGAGAVVATRPAPGRMSGPDAPLSAEIVDVSLGSDGDTGGLLLISGGYSGTPYALGDTVGPEYFIRMQGGLVFKQAVRNMTRQCRTILERNGLSPKDVDLFIPHQANLRIIEAVGERLDITGEKVFINVDRYGNTSAASIPIALAEAVAAGALRRGMKALLTSFGGGFTYGAALLQF